MTQAVRAAARRSSLAAIIVTGNGTFCAGGDLDALRGLAEKRRTTPRLYEPAHEMIRSLLDAPCPTIAAIDGMAVGLGFDLALICDLRLVGPEGKLRQGWARYGAIHGTGGLFFLNRISPTLIWRLLNDQPIIGPDDAERLGLAEAVSGTTALEAALERARNYAKLPTQAVREYVRMTRQLAGRAELEAHLEDCARTQAALFNDQSFARLVGR
jgi:enoyl-CoA hydratase/carnithine racemase